jgi:alkylation response protein AidB-like acyl-CoA dehydrogenase
MQSQTLERVRALAPLIRRRSDEIEQARRLPLDLVAHLLAAGCFRMFVPDTYGGDELSLTQAMTVIEELASADGATGWSTMIGSGSPILFGRLPVRSFETIYANGPDVIGAGSLAPKGRAARVADGYCVAGQWAFASGCQHANWLLAHSVVVCDGEVRHMPNGMPETRVAVFRTDQAEILDTWHVAGLCGTGSQDFRLADVYIPEAHTFSIMDSALAVQGRVFRIPPLAQLPLLIASVALGIARGALEDLEALVGSGKKRLFASQRLGQSLVFQDKFGEADATLRAARAALHTEADGAWARTVDGDAAFFSQLERVRLRATATYVTGLAVDVVDFAYGVAGGTSVYKASPLQRRLRDIHALTQHIGVSRDAFGFVGTLLSGEELDPQRPL